MAEGHNKTASFLVVFLYEQTSLVYSLLYSCTCVHVFLELMPVYSPLMYMVALKLDHEKLNMNHGSATSSNAQRLQLHQ